MSTNGASHPEQYSAVSSTTADASQPSPGSNLSKDEVGWYFVEQYYTTLSKSPDKLHLFYGKKSQFVYGQEAEVSSVSVGRQDIQTRIHKLDFQDCKVRISNVDSQASFDNIVIQVIGETSNKSEEPRKFVQTFVLAQQPSGYFVLNDILRFIKEEEEETAEVAAAPVEAAESAAPEPLPEPVPEQAAAPVEVAEVAAPKAELDTAVVAKKLEEAGTAGDATELESTPTIAVPAEVAAPVAVAQPEEIASTPAEPPVEPKKAAEEASEEDTKKTEMPKEPSPTPAAVRAAAPVVAAAPPAEPEKPKEPSKPMTWASRAAAAAGSARPAVALPKPATPPASSAKPPVAPAPAAVPVAKAVESAPAAAATPAVATGPKDSGNEWQTAGSDLKRQNRPQSISVQDKETTLGYVKYVTEKVDEPTLRQHLEKFGPVVYFDINRSKNCAFIEFASPAGYLAAVAANPHIVNGESIMVEARRPKAGAYGGSNYSNNRGSMSGRGRGGYEGRAGSQGGGRGGFSGQNRGRGGAATRGRGASQAANA